ncbi:MAG: formylglycine-generating enzyme family protein, partial [Myxococcota bacterium]|nr:formylglycine-generating enzyme family protein [Myxococcota bacterium]
CGEDEVCLEGACAWNGTSCGGTLCPEVIGYTHQCNTEDHCEYSPRVQFEPWQSHDVWIHVPPGTFPMGQTEIDPVAFLWNLPSHDVSVAEGYLIGRFEVTVATYEACETAGACPTAEVDPSDLAVDDFGLSRTANGRVNHPQNGLTRDRAEAVCAWLGGRLPSEAEWEYAATGTTHRIYPWGNTPEPSCAAGNGAFGLLEGDKGLGPGEHGCGSNSTYPVGSAPDGRSRRGADDMAGNLFEWTQDCWHSSYDGAPDDGSAWVEGCDGDAGVVRGSDYRRGPALSALAIRVEHDPGAAGAHVGVRCIREL